MAPIIETEASRTVVLSILYVNSKYYIYLMKYNYALTVDMAGKPY